MANRDLNPNLMSSLVTIQAIIGKAGDVPPSSFFASWKHAYRRTRACSTPWLAAFSCRGPGITKMKDGRTHLAHKTEQAVDLETGVVVGVTLQPANSGDTNTMIETL